MPLSKSTLILSGALHAGLVVGAFALGGSGQTTPRRVVLTVERTPERAHAAESLPIAEPLPRAEPLPPPVELREPDVVEPFPREPLPAEQRAPVVPPELLPSDPFARVRATPAPARAPEPEPEPAPSPPTARVLEVLPGENPPPEYPATARRRHLEGTVVVRVEVAATGAVVACRLAQSSGHAVLDDAALAAVRRWRFAGGPGVAEVPFAFVLR
jgi:protein TonB